jgi:hypothetical protein
MIKKNQRRKLHILLALLICKGAFAQVKVINTNASPLDVGIGLLATDKLNPTLDEESEALGLALNAKGQLNHTGEGHWFSIRYDGSIERFSLSEDSVIQEDEQDFVSYRAAILSRLFFSENWHLDTEVQHERRDQKFGFGLSNLRENVLIADEKTQNSASINLVYGADTSNRFISLKYSNTDVSYADNNDYSLLFDYKQQALELNVSFRQSSLTRWLVRIEASEDDFSSQERVDSRLYRALFGINWQPTGKSTLEALIGLYQRDFDDNETDSGLSWSLDYRYRPREDILFKLGSSRSSVVGDNELALSTVFSGIDSELTYFFSEQWNVAAVIEFASTEYEETISSTELNEVAAGVKLTLALKSYNKLNLLLGTRDVNASDDSVDYEQKEIELNWRYQF